MVVHFNNCCPVVSNFCQPFAFSQVNQGENILLETAPSESDTAVQELVSDTSVGSNAFLYLFHVSLVLFAEDSDTVDG